ncbi:RNB domain-containing ribonuclease [Haloechinothrix halophila]|uniref:RNB domain-containing ribonuclease n=1 Tax=Haloechinothrix halophila TaxID=1069073 RepID=UPI0004040361|nr:RNB domain-containing ribonuclease [Haloechinothrix halophila]
MSSDPLPPARTSGRRWDFAAVRAEFDLPDGFAPDTLAEAEDAVVRARELSGDRYDATDIPVVTIDPPGARDLDQAMRVERLSHGYRVRYAIADLGAFVTPSGAVDREATARGQTLYLPDGTVPLHPPVLSERAASLLPGEVRPAVLWTIDTDDEGNPVDIDVRRAIVRSVGRFDYQGVVNDVARGEVHPSLATLPEFGTLRRRLAAQRGAIELQLPEQEVTSDGNGGWRLALRLRTEIDAFNAEISLLTGMCAAELMLEAGVGILRTVVEADEDAHCWLRESAQALGIDWPHGTGVADVLSGLDPARPESLAFYADSTRLLRGAGYTTFDGAPPSASSHAGIGGPYTHVTAPIRRLVDRYATEVCLAVCAGTEVPEWTRAGLAELPSAMGTSDALAAKVERACLDQVESWVLADRVGETFDAVVLRGGGEQVEVLISDPPVLASCDGTDLAEGQRVTVRLTAVDTTARTVTLEPVP